MSQRKRYRKYLYDDSEQVPSRTRRRWEFKNNQQRNDADGNQLDNGNDGILLEEPLPHQQVPASNVNPVGDNADNAGVVNIDEEHNAQEYLCVSGDDGGNDVDLFEEESSASYGVQQNESEVISSEDGGGNDEAGNDESGNDESEEEFHGVRQFHEADTSESDVVDEESEGESAREQRNEDSSGDDGRNDGSEHEFDDEQPNLEVDEPLYEGSDVTKMQMRVTLLRYIFRHQMSGQALEDMLVIWNLSYPGIFPKSKYLFKKMLSSHLDYNLHYYCDCCSEVIPDRDGRICPHCHEPFSYAEADRKENYFAVFPLQKQLESLLLDEGLCHKLTKRSEIDRCRNMSDLHSGYKMRELSDTGRIRDDDITLLVSLDGVQPFKCSERSFWPILATVNELDPSVRNSHVMMLGLWLGKGKPSDSYLQTVLDENHALSQQGFQWITPDNNVPITSRVFVIMCTADSPAQACIRNCHQFNGRFGCPQCYMEGETVEKGDGTVRVYPSRDQPAPPRNAGSHFEESRQALETSSVVNGVKGPSPLMTAPNFDIVVSFVSEYMHCIQNVMRNLTAFWFDSANHQRPFYIGRRIHELDNELRKMKPPNEITRTTATVSSRKYWKASQYRSFCLHYGPVVMKNKLPAQYYEHFLVLSWCLYSMIESEVTMETIGKVESALAEFVKDFETLYGVQNVTYNVHLLTHMADSVRRWGPLWAYSMFPFEGMNHTIMKLKHGTQHCVKQVADAYICSRGVQRMANKCLGEASEPMKEINDRLAHVGHYKPKTSNEYGRVRVYGRRTMLTLSRKQATALSEFTARNVNEGEKVGAHLRFSVPNMTLHCLGYRRLVSSKRNNSLVQLIDRSFGLIDCLVILDNDDKTTAVIVQKCDKVAPAFHRNRRNRLTIDHIHELRVTDDFIALHVEEIYRKCISLRGFVDQRHFFAQPLPNAYETD